jgi:hypothetical protein
MSALYSDFDIRTIRECADRRTDAEIAAVLGRTPEAISKKRRGIGIGRDARVAALEAAVLALLERVERLEAAANHRRAA